MFEAAELGHVVAPQRYDRVLPRLRARLLDLHLALRSQKFPVIVIVSGADGAGKGELVQRLNEWLDPRGVNTHAFWAPSDEERERPDFWRFWRAMPGRGRIGIFFGSWYSQPIISRVFGEIKKTQLDAALERIAAFERMLTDDGALILKLWLHLPKKEQKKRLKRLEKDGRLAPDDWKHFKLYDKFTEVSAQTIRHTDKPRAPWHVIEATDRRYRELTTAELLIEALEKKFKTVAAKATEAKPAARPVVTTETVAPAKPTERRKARADSILAGVDLTQRLTDAEYKRQLEVQQTKLSKLAWAAQQKGVSTVLAFEGWDAAGKGSAIRRVTQAMDPRLYRVIGIAAPTDEERAQHYLWRFWRHLPRAGFTTIFDRTWYGRVLVERVEGFAKPDEWGRAYDEINAFEEQLVARGSVLCKFWVHLSPQEQLRRFKERQAIAYKRYKITDEDWRNREKWPDYHAVVDDMVKRCSTEFAPWTLVAGNDKKFARVQILKTIVQRLDDAL